MSLTRTRLIVLGILTLLVGLVVLFPARIAYRLFAPPEATLSDIGGTVWAGRATHADIGGIYLRDIRWRMKPLEILQGRLGYALEASPAPGNLSADASIGFDGSIALRDINGTLPLQAIARAANMPGLQGRLTVQMERLVLENGLPVAANGEIQVAQLLAPLVHRGPIGGYRIEFFTQNSGVMASIEDTDGAVDLAGSLQVTGDRTYTFVGLVAPKATTPGRLRQQMQFLGTANERGQYELRLEGSL